MPTGITSITVTGTYLRGDLTAASGYVTFVPSVTIADPSGPAMVTQSTVTVPLNASGGFSVTLAATDDVATSPTGWAYTVVENIDDHVRSYQVALPHAAPSVDISNLTPVTTVPTTYSYATIAALLAKVDRTGDTMTGPLTLAGAPTTNLMAATKLYVDGLTAGGPFVPLAGGTMTGPLVISGSTATIPTVFGSAASGGNLQLTSTSNATKGFIYLGAGAAWDGANGRLGVGTQAPGVTLDVEGSASAQLALFKRTSLTDASPVVQLLAGDTTAGSALAMSVVGDAQNRFGAAVDGKLSWGSGAATRDTNLYRSTVGTLKTDGALVVAGRITGPQVLTANGTGNPQAITNTEADVTGATLTFTTTKTNTIVFVTGVFDLSIGTGSTSTIIGKCAVDGTVQNALAVAVFPTTGGRATITQTWVVTLATAASHTIKLRAINNTGQTVNSNFPNTTISVAVFDF